jgi:hypothetical protein
VICICFFGKTKGNKTRTLCVVMALPTSEPGVFDNVKDFLGQLDELTLVLIIAGIALYCALVAFTCVCVVRRLVDCCPIHCSSSSSSS